MALNESNLKGSAVVGTTAVQILSLIDDMRFERKVFSVTNTSTGGQIIYLSFGSEAVSGVGQPLYPGGTYIESRNEGFVPTNDSVWVIASAANGSVSVMARTVPVV